MNSGGREPLYLRFLFCKSVYALARSHIIITREDVQLLLLCGKDCNSSDKSLPLFCFSGESPKRAVKIQLCYSAS